MQYHKRRLVSTILSLTIMLSMLVQVVQSGLHLSSAQEAEGEPANASSEENIKPLTDTDDNPPDFNYPTIAIFQEDFQDGDVSDWSLSEGWGLMRQDENIYLTATTPSQTATITDQLWENVSITAWFSIDEGNTATISARVGENAYITQIESSGMATLFKGDDLLVEGLTPTHITTYHEPATERTWYKVNVQAINGDLNVSVNDGEQIAYTDEDPLPAGWVVFSTGASNNGVVILDNVTVQEVTPNAEDDSGGLTETNPNSTEEPPVTATPEPLTPTTEPEIPTATPTSEDDSETDEPIPTDEIEPTPVPFSLSEAIGGKVGAALFNLVEVHTAGGETEAYRIADNYFIEYDTEGRLRLIIWGVAGHLIAPQIQEAGGIIQRVDDDHVEVFISPSDLIIITQYDNIFAVTVPNAVVSTSDKQSGTTAPVEQDDSPILAHSIDILGVNSWHQADYKGGSVKIAVIDVGFNGTNGEEVERACLGSNAVEGSVGDSSHGIEMVEVICDIAPLSRVYMYSASTVSEVELAIKKAARLEGTIPDTRFPQADVIVIATDTGLSTDFLPTVDAAVNNNIPVIVPAGNNGNNGALSFLFNGGESDLTVIASAGSILSYAWEEPAGPTSYPTTLLWGEEIVDSRPVRTGQAHHQYIVPASCGNSCVMTLNITGERGTNFDVQITGSQFDALYPTDNTLTPLASGSLTELASNDNVISVGAVCPWQEGNGSSIDRYQILPDSSTGDPSQPNNNLIKPSVVAPARVATSITPVEPECEGGFGQTSAAAAHVAGVAALLHSNENMQGIANTTAGVPNALKAYLQSHTIDLHVGDTADGFDNVYGAGLIQLGNPEFKLGIQQQIISEASEIPTGAVYVDSSRIYTSGEPDGTIIRPYVHPAQAVQQAVTSLKTNVVLLPGEYVTSFKVPNPNASSGGLTITSYDAVDGSNWFSSDVWVNDSFEGIAGIRLDNVDKITVRGLNFTGSTPLYEDILPSGGGSSSLQIAKLTPFDITKSTNVTIMDNTFKNFDAPVIIKSSENVKVQNNSFENFDIATTTDFIDLSEVKIPLYNTTVFDVVDSGQTNRVVFEFNLFQNNTIPITIGTQNSTIQEPIIRIERSQVDIRSSRFVENNSESVIAINQWKANAETAGAKPTDSVVDVPVTIFSTVFDNNTVDGSLIQGYQIPQLRFINNTVVNHSLNSDQFGHIIGLGHLETDRLSVVDHRIEMHNNLFYNNTVKASLYGTNFDSTIGADGCLPIGGTVGQPRNGARFNWFAPSFDGGECATSIGTPNTPANNNIYTEQWEGVPLIGTTDNGPSEESAAARTAFENYHFFTAINDSNHPWRLRPTPDEFADPPPDPIKYNPGIETGDLTVVQAIPGLVVPFFDARGNVRPINRPPSPDQRIDIGAYELGDPSPIKFIGNGSVTRNVPEDTPVLINLRDIVEGGFEPYQFKVENLPSVFDTNPLNACNGQPYYIEPVTYVFTYCPPPDFWNDGLTTTFPQSEIHFTYEVFGILSAANAGTGKATISINITSVKESEPLLPEKQIDFIIDPKTELKFKLEPYAEFDASGNLVFSDPDISPFAQSPDVDYLFNYSDVVVDIGAERFNPQLFNVNYPEDPSQLTADQITSLNKTLNDAITSDHVLRVFSDTPGGWTPELNETGVIEFTYDVTDKDGDMGKRRVRIRIVEQLGGTDPGDEPGDTGDTGTVGPPAPPDTDGPGSDLNTQIEHLGLHDDSSLEFTYSDGWVPFYYGLAINETLHYNTANDQSFEFSFGGDSFALRWLSYDGAGSYTLEIDDNDDGEFKPYNDSSLALTCTGGASGNPISTSRTAVQFTSFGCSGLELTAPEKLHTIRVTTTSGTIWIDAIEIRQEGLLPGFYQVEDFAINASDGWEKPGAFPGPSGDSLFYTNKQDETLRFTVDGTLVDTLMVYRTTGKLWGTFDIRFNGQVAYSANSTGDDLDASGKAVNYWNQAVAVPGIGDGLVEVEIRTTGADYVGIEAIELLSIREALDAGFTPLYNTRIRAGGNWGLYQDVEARTGNTYYNAQPDGGSIIFAVDGGSTKRIVLHHSVWEGAIRVCGRTCTDAIEHKDKNMRYTAIDVDKLGLGNATENVTVNVTDFYVGLESIEVIEDLALQPGYYDQIRDASSMIYTDVGGDNGWYHVYGPLYPELRSPPRDSSASWAKTDTESISFPVSAGIKGLVIYHAESGTIRVCADDGSETCFNISAGSSFLYGKRSFVTADQLGLDPTLKATITIKPADNNWIGLEGIQVVGTPEDTVLGTLTKTRVNPSNSAIRYVDTWNVWRPLEAETDQVYYTLSPHAGVFFKFDGAALNVGYVTGLGTGNFEICIDAATCQIIEAGSAAATIQYDNMATVNAGGDGLHVAEIRSLDKGWIGLTSFGVNRTREPLSIGFFNDDHVDLNFKGLWTPLIANDVKGGTYKYATDSSNALTFTVDPNVNERIVIYHPNASIWGQMEICVNNTCTTYPQGNASRRYTPIDLPSGSIADVKVSPAEGYIGIEGIEVYPTTDGRGLGPGFYDDKDVFLNYDGSWFTYESFDYKGGSVVWSNNTGKISFNVDSTRTNSIAIHHPAGVGWGQIKVCGSTCQDINLGTATKLVTDIPVTGDNSLALTGNSAPITIEWVSGFGGFDGVEVVGTNGMGPGYYEDDSVSINTTGEWFPILGAYSGAVALWSESADAEIKFDIGGGITDIDRPTTGFTAYFARYSAGATIRVCITRISTSKETCSDETTVSPTGAFETIYGISFLGLPQLTIDGAQVEKHTVSIRKTGGGWLGFDSVAVHGAFRGKLRQDEDFRPKVYDDGEFSIIYSPEPLWGNSSFVGSNLYKNTVAWTGNAGGLAQVALRGNSLTMYQIPFNGASDDVRFCLVIGTVTNSGVQCANYSLNDFFNTSSATSAITLYGFGFGNHEVYIENRDHLGFLALDAIQVR